MADRLGHGPDQLRYVALLLRFAIDGKPKPAALKMADRAGGVERTDRRRPIKCLADLPRTAHLAHFHLQVPPGHVEPNRIAPDMIERLSRRNIRSALADGSDQLRLVVVVLRLGWICKVERLTVRHGHHGVGRLAEEERRLPVWIETHLARMCRVISADAVDPANRKAVIAADDGDCDGRFGREDICHDNRFAYLGKTKGVPPEEAAAQMRSSRSRFREASTGRSE